MKKLVCILSFLSLLLITTEVYAKPIPPIIEETCYESFQGEDVYFSLVLYVEGNQITGYLYMQIFEDISYATISGEDTGADDFLTLDYIDTDENGNPTSDVVSQALLKLDGDKVELNIGEIVYFDPIPCD